MSRMQLNYKYKGIMGIANDTTYGIHQPAVTLSQKANLAAAGRYQSRVSCFSFTPSYVILLKLISLHKKLARKIPTILFGKRDKI